ncbi:diguanylate cyclase [Acetobacterium paludosum]|uniref:Diguanylate cyclase n=1 Tax=Acetobacterium paludosum TaxID=52693 RepID=A0A923I6L5_9FIRM|nr:GGDEF domain-containing protein [Acetobacterium paludosum]MBC3889935.1 diguanylate cyclase [Acetobacterium paludosum]
MARFGGEEFSIICMGSEADHIYDLMENLRIEFENQRYDFMEDTITISIGISTWKLGWTAEELFENADSAMYVAKANGKNQTKQ